MTSIRSKRPQPECRCFRLQTMVVSLIVAGLISPRLMAAPEAGVVQAGQASIQTNGSLTLIRQSSNRAIINWRSFGTLAGETVRFEQPSTTSATLNRVTGGQVSVLLGRLEANGQVFLINPYGIVFGKGAQINVGGLVASTADIDNQDFMAGLLAFSQPGQPGAAVVNFGEITAAEGGLVALVAPQVRNDGIITARLGRVVLAAGDTFTLDLYGDQLINLAMSDAHVGQLVDADGQPVAPHVDHAGTIDAAGGKVVLVSAATGKNVLDEVINLSGVIRADAVSQQGGEILLLGQGGTVNVSGSLSAAGLDAGQQGGSIEVLGDQVNLAATASLDASGQSGGGTLHVGGAWQGQGDTYHAQNVQVAAGAQLAADALAQGNGGEVVVWSEGHTHYAGNISARGGQTGGNGGRVEVSGKQTLDFKGDVDLAAPNGQGGSLLLDPAYFNIGLTEASLLNRILRTGATATLQADVDININAMIDGRGRYAGGGLNLIAGNDININNYIVTYNGTVRLNAGSDITVAPGYGVFTGNGAIYASSGNTLSNTGLVSASLLHLTSTGGGVNIDTGIDSGIGSVVLVADDDVNITQPVVNLKNGSPFTATAGGNINVNAQIDGRGGTAGGTATLTAGNNILLNQSIVTNNGAIALAATAGTVTPAVGMGLFAGNGAISVTTGGDYSTGIYGTTGALTLSSTAGKLTVAEKIDETVGNVSLSGQTGVDVDQGIANIRNGSDLTITAVTGDININARIDAQDNGTIAPVPGGAVTLTAGNNVNINETIVTNDGPVNVTATAGTVTFADSVGDGSGNKKIITGNAPITVTTGGDFSTGIAPPVALALADYGDGTRYLWDSDHPDGITTEEIHQAVADQLKPWVTLSTTGKLTLTSTGGNVTIDAPIPYTTGEIEINGVGVIVNEHLVSNNQPITINAGSSGIVVNEAKSSNYSITVNYTNDGINQVSQTLSTYGTTIDSKNANLTLASVGDIDINGPQVASAQTLTLDTRGAILGGGGIERSRYNSAFPQYLNLTGDLGIGSAGSNFSAGQQSNTTAVSSLGDIYLGLFVPSSLSITANAGSIYTFGWLGAAATMNAGTDIDVRGSGLVGTLSMTAGRDIKVKIMDAASITAEAGRDALFDATIADDLPQSDNASIWLDGSGGLTVTAGRDIRFLNDSGVSIKNGDPTTGTEPSLVLEAGGSVELRRLQTYGSVDISAGTGITLWNDIGPTITSPIHFTSDQGVASLSLTTPTTAGSFITMQGARAVGDVAVTTGTLTAARSITSTGGTVTIDATSENITPGAIGTMTEMTRPPQVSPVASPGPAVNAPTPPGAIDALPAGAPGSTDVAGMAAPGGGSDSLTEIFVPEPSTQVAGQGESPSGTSLSEDEQLALAASLLVAGVGTDSSADILNPLAFDTATGAFLVFAGGRGDAFEEEERRRRR